MCVRAHYAGVFNKKYEGGFFGVIILDQREMVFRHQLPVFAKINKGGTRLGRIWVSFSCVWIKYYISC